jgi:hypothetical protein
MHLLYVLMGLIMLKYLHEIVDLSINIIFCYIFLQICFWFFCIFSLDFERHVACNNMAEVEFCGGGRLDFL